MLYTGSSERERGYWAFQDTQAYPQLHSLTSRHYLHRYPLYLLHQDCYWVESAQGRRSVDGHGIYYGGFNRACSTVDTQPKILWLVLPPLHVDSYPATHHVLDWLYLPYSHLQFHRESFLPDGGRCADDAFCADAVPWAYSSLSTHGTYLWSGHHFLHLYPRHLCQEHRPILSEAATDRNYQRTKVDGYQDG